MKPKYSLGQNVETEGFGPAIVTDVFLSTIGNPPAYRVQPENGEEWLVNESEIIG